MFYFEPERDSEETRQAKRILRHMDTVMFPKLYGAEKWRQEYVRARNTLGDHARTHYARPRYGGPRIRIAPEYVSGFGDDAYGHNRVRAIVERVMLPMLEEGDPLVDAISVHTIMHMCRGWFANEYIKLERAIAVFNHNRKE